MQIQRNRIHRVATKRKLGDRFTAARGILPGTNGRGADLMQLSAFELDESDTSIARAFFITAATFGAMSLWGYTTKRDLSAFGSFMMMGVIGIALASLVNLGMTMFGVPSPMLSWLTSVIGVVVFTGLTAWDTQAIKQSYADGYGLEANSKLAVMSALQLYLNFINAFTFLLRLMGDRR